MLSIKLTPGLRRSALAVLVLLSPLFALAQTNIALTAASVNHSSGGSGSYGSANYNDNFIGDPVLNYGWVNNNGWIEYTWADPMKIDQIHFYFGDRPMTSTAIQYWNGSSYVTHQTYTRPGAATGDDAVNTTNLVTTRLRFNQIVPSSVTPNFREIKVFGSVAQILNAPSFPAQICAGDVHKVGYSTIGTFPAGTIIRLYLSNASGSFASGKTLLGWHTLNVATTNPTDTILAEFPPSTPQGSNYRIRLETTVPVLASPDNGADIAVDVAPFNVTGGGVHCSGSSGVAVGLSGSEPGVNYQLFLNGNPSGSPVAGTGAALSFGNKTVAGTYTVVGTGTIGTCTENMTGSAIVTASSAPTITLGASPTVTTGVTTASLPYTATTHSPTSYAITWDATALGAGFANVASGTILPASPMVIAVPGGAPASTYNGSLVVSNGACNSTSYPFTVTVSATPPPAITTQPIAQVVCNGNSVTYTADASNATSYHWQGSTDGTNWFDINPAYTNAVGTLTKTLTLVNAQWLSGYYFRLEATGPTAPVAYSDAVHNRISTATASISATNVSCFGGSNGSATASVTNGVAPYTYSWNTTPAQTTATISGLTPGSYTVTITDSAGCTDDATVTITEPTELEASAQAQTNVACNGAATGTATVLAAEGTPPYTYSWSPSGGTAATAAGLTAGNYTVTVKDDNDCIATQSFTITQPAAMPAYNVTGGGDYCSGGTGVAIGLSGSELGTSYQLYTNAGADAVGTPVAGTGAAISFGNHTAAGTYTVVATNNTTHCERNMNGDATVVVNPIPDVDVVANQSVCHDAATTAIVLDGTVPGTSFAWTNNETSIGLAAAGTGDIASFTAANTTNAPVTATITVTPTANGCVGADETFDITVNPTPTVAAVADQTLCNTEATTAVGFTGDVAGTVYNWTNNTTSIGLAANGTGDIASFTATNTTSAAVTATVTVAPSANGCAGTTESFDITVNPTPNVVAVADQTVCHTDATTAVTFSGAVPGTTYNWTNNETSIGLAATGTGAIASFTAVNTTNAPVTATITVTPVANSCTGVAQSFDITVNPTPTVAAVADQTLCNTEATTAVSFTGHATGTVYNWTNNTTSIGLAANGTGDIASFNAANATNAPVTATITVTPAIGACAGTAETFDITVNPTPTVNAVANQVVCNNAAVGATAISGTVSGTTYNWTNDMPSIGLAAAGTGDIPAFTAINTTNAPVVATINITPVANNCAGPVSSFTIIVNPTPNIAAVADQTLCNSEATTAVAFSGDVAGTTYSWTNDNTTIGLPASGNGNIASFVATNTTNAPETATITVTPAANNCAGAATSFDITVNPTPTVAAVADQTLCNTEATTAISFSGDVAGTTYNWINSNTAIGLAANGSGNIVSFTATNTTNAPITATITVTPAANNCTGATTTFDITVNPTPTVAAVADQTLCNTEATAAISFSGDVAGTVYNWTNDNTSIGLAASGTGNIASFAAVNNTNAPVTATITVTPSANNCDGASETFTITVNPTPDVAAVADQTLCNNEATTAVNFSGAVSGTTYSWTNDNTAIGLAASGNGTISSFNATNTTNAPISGTITVTPMANNCVGAATTFTYTVNPTPDVNAVANQVLCNTESTTAVNFSGAVAGTTYSWTNDDASIGLAASGNGNIAAFTATNITNAPVTATITVTPSANNCAGPVGTFEITVNPTPDVAAIADQTRCNTFSTAAVNFSGSVSGTAYSWTNNNTSIGLAASGNGDIASFTATNTTNAPVTATITVTPSANGCTGPSETFDITVNPTPDVVAVANQTLCNTEATNAVNFSGAVSGTTYSWTNTDASIGLAAGGNGNIPSFTATNTGSAPVTATITVTPSANGCSGSTESFDITVNPTPVVDPVTSQILCNTFATTDIIFAGPVSGTVYNWTNNTTSIGLAANGTGDILSFTATNATNAPVTATITVTPTANNCVGASEDFNITVNPTPTVDPVADETLCNDATTTPVVFTGSVTGTVFNWVNSDASIGLAATGAGDIASFTATNITAAPVTGTIAVTPVANNCLGATMDFAITVNPTPDVATITGQTLCNTASSAPVNFVGAVSGTTFDWTNTTPAIGLASSGTGNIPSFTAVNNTPLPVVATVTVTPSANNCVGLSKNFAIRVNPTPKLSSTLTPADICANTTFQYKPASLTPGTKFSWSRAVVANIDNPPASGTGDIAEQLNNVNTLDEATVLYVYTLVANGCTNQQTVTLNVDPVPHAPVISGSLSEACANTKFQNFSAAAPQPAGVQYAWTAPGAELWASSKDRQYSLVSFPWSGNALVVLTANVPGITCTSADTAFVNVKSSTAKDARIVYYNGRFICLDNKMDSYQWGYDDASSLDSVSFAGEQNQDFYEPDANFTNRYYWVITTSEGCSQKSYYNMPSSVHGTVNTDLANVKVYPNPTTAYADVEISGAGAGNLSVQLGDISGRTLRDAPVINGKARLFVGDMPAGVYTVTCYYEGMRIAVTKLVKN